VTDIITIEDAAEGPFFFTVSLGGIDFILKFQFNSREKFWYMDVQDTAGNQIRSGLKVVVNYPLLLRWKETGVRPVGELFVIDTRAEPQDPGLEDLGVNGILAYE